MIHFNRNIYDKFNPVFDTSHNSIYELNNFIPTDFFTKNPYTYIKAIKDGGGAIWLNTNGNIYYRLSYGSNIHTATASKASLVFSNFLNMDIKISTKPIPTNDKKFIPNNPILVNQLLLVAEERFSPHMPFEFYNNEYICNFIYRNTFKPSSYLQLVPTKYNQTIDSITLQYIYYLSNYNYSKFQYIMNWMATFFKNLSYSSNTTLVLLGEQNSGKEILFNNIISPLFGREYCIDVNDDNLQIKNLSQIVTNKLFYNLNNLSNKTVENKTIKSFLKNSLIAMNTYTQTLITIDRPSLPYMDKDYHNYTVFKVPDNIENMSIPDWFNSNNKNKLSLTNNELLNAISNDLENFALILKSYPIDPTKHNEPFNNDDKESIIYSLEDKLKIFADAIMMDTNRIIFQNIKKSTSLLYEELMEDFNHNKIKQRNLIKCFNILYPEAKFSSPKTFFSKLRQADDSDSFKKEAIQIGSGGIKYYAID